MISPEMRAQFLKENLAFLDQQMLIEPSVNGQVGFDFQGLRRSYRENPSHPDSKSVAGFGRIWIYDVALAIYADLKAGRIRQAGYQAGRLLQLGQQEQAKGFKGLWHFSYNTRGDFFIDPRGPAGANAWCLNALYSYILARGDPSALPWVNRALRAYLFQQQVVDSGAPRCGLVRAGLYNADDIRKEDSMGYQVYEGDLNHAYDHVILEHCIDAAGTFRLAWRANRRFGTKGPGTGTVPGTDVSGFLEELARRHDLLMQGARRCFWQRDHFVSAVDPEGRPYTGADGLPSVAVDNNTWAAYVFLPYDPELALAAVRYVEEQFVVGVPPAHVEDTVSKAIPEGLRGLYYFRSNFVDPFVQVPAEFRAKMENLLQPEAAFGFILFLLAASDLAGSARERERLKGRAEELYRHTVELQRLYGPSGAPYASANVPMVFSTLSSVTTAANGAIATAILQGAPADDFIGVAPPQEFTVAGKPPLRSW